MAGHIASATRTDWRTPTWLVSSIESFFRSVSGGEVGIQLDPCASPKRAAHFARRNIHPPADGLRENWAGQNVYCNPPYGRGIRDWARKACALRHEDLIDGTTNVILLIPAAVDTKHWQKGVFRCADAVCFIEGRLHFDDSKVGAPMACALVYFGAYLGDFLGHFKAIGYCAAVNR